MKLLIALSLVLSAPAFGQEDEKQAERQPAEAAEEQQSSETDAEIQADFGDKPLPADSQSFKY